MTPDRLDVALFRGESAAELIPLAMIEPWADQPRRSIDDARLLELAESIGKVGVLQPILVRPIREGAMFGIVSGERRWRAARRAGLDHIPAVVRTLTDAEALELAVTENLQREDVPPLDEAEGYERLHQVHGYSIDDIADKVGKSRTYVYARLKLTSLCDDARAYLRDGRLTPTVALLVARIPTPSQQVEAAKYCAADRMHGQPLSATAAADYIRRTYMLRLADAQFDAADAALVPAAGACSDCPKRTGAHPELFGDIAEEDTCTDGGCYEGKTRAWLDRYARTQAMAGATVIRGAEAAPLIGHSGRTLSPRGLVEYVALHETCPHDHGHRLWRSVLFGDEPITPSRLVLIERPRDGWLHAAIKAVAMEMLAELGIVERSPAPLIDAGEPVAAAEPAAAAAPATEAGWPFPTPGDDPEPDHIADVGKMVEAPGALPPVSTLIETISPDDRTDRDRRAYMATLATQLAHRPDIVGIDDAEADTGTLRGLCWSLAEVVDMDLVADIVGIRDGWALPSDARAYQIRDALLGQCATPADLHHLLWALLLAIVVDDYFMDRRPQSAGILEHMARSVDIDPAGVLGQVLAELQQEREIEEQQPEVAAPAKKARAPRKSKVKSESAAAGAADMDNTPAAPAPVEEPAP